MRRPWKLGMRKRDCDNAPRTVRMRCSIYEESFGENRALYVHLTYEDVDRFRKGSVLELYCLKAGKPGKQSSRSKSSRFALSGI